MEVLDPTTIALIREDNLAGVNSLKGKVVAILSNGWPSLEAMIVRFNALLSTEHGVAKTIYYDIPRNAKAPDALLAKIADECDAAIVGLGN